MIRWCAKCRISLSLGQTFYRLVTLFAHVRFNRLKRLFCSRVWWVTFGRLKQTCLRTHTCCAISFACIHRDRDPFWHAWGDQDLWPIGFQIQFLLVAKHTDIKTGSQNEGGIQIINKITEYQSSVLGNCRTFNENIITRPESPIKFVWHKIITRGHIPSVLERFFWIKNCCTW